MPTQNGQRRSYNLQLINPIPPKCSDFHSYIQRQITGSREMLNINVNSSVNDCIVDLDIQCWSIGKYNAANFLNSVLITFPKVTVKSFTRRRLSKQERDARSKAKQKKK